MHSTNTLARGAGLIFLGRMGAVIEILTVFLFTRLYGAETFGVFTLFWGYVLVLTVFCGAGMTMALQRFVPGEPDEGRIHRAVRFAIVLPAGLGVAQAVLVSVLAADIAPFFNTGIAEPTVAAVIRLYAWAVPVMCIVESATAAIRARHVFGPEVKIRVFYEQSLRLAGGVGFHFLGYAVYGLFVSHLIALVFVSLFALRLLFRHYSWRRFLESGQGGGPVLRDMAHFGGLMIVPQISRKLLGNLPLLFLNAMIPGAAGAVAVTVYAVARKIVSALQVIRESFEYVLAPIATADERKGGESDLNRIYAFATRLMVTLFIPAATLVLLFRTDLLRAAGEEFRGETLAAASTVVVILGLGRMFETLAGPAGSVIAMIGRYRLPLINAAAGILTTAALLVVLIPSYGLPGAALAVAVGTNVISLMALAELYRLRRLQPYDRSLMAAIAMSACASAVLYGFVTVAALFGLWAKLAAGLAGGAVLVYSLIRGALRMAGDGVSDRNRADKTGAGS